MIQEIKQLRTQIDGLAQLAKELKPLDALWGDPNKAPENAAFKHIMVNSKEIEKAVDSLLLAKAWLGIVLKELGNESPYPKDGTRKTVDDIESTADTYPGEVNDYKIGDKWRIEGLDREPNHIEKVDWLRTEIQKIIDNTEDFSENLDYIELEQGFVYKYLCEARFWLGFELSRYRDENKK